MKAKCKIGQLIEYTTDVNEMSDDEAEISTMRGVITGIVQTKAGIGYQTDDGIGHTIDEKMVIAVYKPVIMTKTSKPKAKMPKSKKDTRPQPSSDMN